MTSEAAPDASVKTRQPPHIGRTVFLAFMGLAIVAWVSIAIASNTKAPGVVGFLSALFGGSFVFLFIAAVGGWIALKLSEPEVETKAAVMAPGELPPDLVPILADLETYRLGVVRQVKERSAWRVPLAMAAGIGGWTLLVLFGFDGGVFDFLVVMIICGLGGHYLASAELSKKYGDLYREKVLPRLAATFGDVTWRKALAPDLARLKAERVFRGEFTVEAENEIAGNYRGLPISITELRLGSREKKDDAWTFDGLLVRISLKRDTGAVTAVIADAGKFGNMRDRMAAEGRQRVKLEDPVFERIYEVYSTDQVAARALLHPAFMAKLLKLGEKADFGAPMVLCSGAVLELAIPKRAPVSLFATPGWSKSAANRLAMVRLREDMAAVLAVADGVTDLDHRFGA